MHLSITLQIMFSIKDSLSRQPRSQFNIMLWVACCLTFFGFLRVTEFTVLSQDTYNSDTHLSLALDKRVNSHFIAVYIKRSKTNPFWKGVTLYLGQLITLSVRWLVFTISKIKG